MRKCNYLKGILLGIFAGAWISSTAFAENVDIKTECEMRDMRIARAAVLR